MPHNNEQLETDPKTTQRRTTSRQESRLQKPLQYLTIKSKQIYQSRTKYSVDTGTESSPTTDNHNNTVESLSDQSPLLENSTKTRYTHQIEDQDYSNKNTSTEVESKSLPERIQHHKKDSSVVVQETLVTIAKTAKTTTTSFQKKYPFMDTIPTTSIHHQDESLAESETMGGYEDHHEHHQPSTTSFYTKVRRCLQIGVYNPVCSCLVQYPTIADEIQIHFPLTAGKLLKHSKMTFVGIPIFVFLLDCFIILPGYLVAKVITEFGVYILMTLTIWAIGRAILRLIAFPGSTSRLVNEIEGEFQKYSIKMLMHTQNTCVDLANLLISLDEENKMVLSNSDTDEEYESNKMGQMKKLQKLFGVDANRQDALLLWKKVKQYRDRILSVFHDVMDRLLSPEEQRLEEIQSSRYGNNPLVGDIGDLATISSRAREETIQLCKHIKVILDGIEILEKAAGEFLSSSAKDISKRKLSQEAVHASQRLLLISTEFGSFLESLGQNDTYEDEPIRTSLFGELMHSIKGNAKMILEILDPPPSNSVFGLDVLRGCMLSRYMGAQQIWIGRPKSKGSGLIDAVHIPSDGNFIDPTNNHTKIEKVVIFCNPNAGLFETSTGLGLLGGNVSNSRGSEITSWTDFYIENGYDVIMFNYSCYGRSHKGKYRKQGHKSGCLATAIRLFQRFFLAPKPSPTSLKDDATIVANHLIDKIGVNKMVLHGESIGGLSAAGATVALSGREDFDDNDVPITYPSILICDRTFCNLVAVAQRMVGSWTGSVIPLLTPWWNTDVAADFLNARCKKVLAQDAADSIIHYSSSLKKGVSITKEIKSLKTQHLSQFLEAPLTYRMSDHQDVGVLYSSFDNPSRSNEIPSPTWPTSNHIDISQAFHFAACVRRIGKVATNIRKRQLLNSLEPSLEEDEEEGVEITAVFSRDQANDMHKYNTPEDNILMEVWETLARCDGLTGMPLGATVKEGHDCVVDWLTCILTLGTQRVALAAEERSQKSSEQKSSLQNAISIKDCDFDFFYPGYNENDDDDDTESVERISTLPIPKVLTELEILYKAKGIEQIQHELEYSINTLRYIVDRLSDRDVVSKALRVAHFQDLQDQSPGRYLNLTCGHNNQYSVEEKIQLLSILTEALERGSTLA